MRAIEFLLENDETTRITLGGNQAAKNWIEKVYKAYPTTFQNNHVMLWGEGENQQMASFELTPSFTKRGAVEVKWISAYPQRQGVGSKAMKELQRLAQEDNITLTLFPWDKGQVSQSKLTKFYKGQGFKPTVKGAKSMFWEPSVNEEITDEMALKQFTPMGDFNKPGPFKGVDKRLVPHPTNQLKTQKFFEQTPYDFRLFFSNIPGTGKYSETGPVTPQQLQQMFGEQAQPIIEDSDDSITVVFVGNSGDSKVMMTPWIMAHRFGHAIQAGVRRNRGWHTWAEAEKHFFTAINGMLEEYYGKQSSSRMGVTPASMRGDLTPEYNALFNAIGTQRSSRSGEIKRPYEFLYEIFAQYLGTGQVTFNPLPSNLGYGRKNWGNPSKYMNLKPEYRSDDERVQATQTLANDMQYMFDDVLSSSVGQIFVM